MTDAIDAAMLAGLKVMASGKKGIGKSQLLFDTRNAFFGGKGKVIEGRPDLKLEQLFERIAISPDQLKNGFNSETIHQLAAAIDYHFFGMDEITYCPEQTQTAMLSLMNGYLMFKGEPVKLGSGYCFGIATGNPNYAGSFRLNEALQDRLHLFLNFDYWRPTDEDMALIDERNHVNPGVKEDGVRDISDRIIAAHKELTARETAVEAMIAARFFERALDYCETYPAANNSKEALGDAWPSICAQKSCHLQATACGHVKAVGERTVQAMKRLAAGLEYVAHLKRPETAIDSFGAIFTAAKLVLPYAGVISPVFMLSEGMFGSPVLAAHAVIDDVEKTVREAFFEKVKDEKGVERSPPLVVALAYANAGRLEEYKTFSPDKQWSFVLPLYKSIDKAAKRKKEAAA